MNPEWKRFVLERGIAIGEMLYMKPKMPKRKRCGWRQWAKIRQRSRSRHRLTCHKAQRYLKAKWGIGAESKTKKQPPNKVEGLAKEILLSPVLQE